MTPRLNENGPLRPAQESVTVTVTAPPTTLVQAASTESDNSQLVGIAVSATQKFADPLLGSDKADAFVPAAMESQASRGVKSSREAMGVRGATVAESFTGTKKNIVGGVLAFAFAAAFCALIAWGSGHFAQIGYDWGYECVKQFIGQPSSDDQWLGAGLLKMVLIPIVGLGMVAGYLQGIFRGRARWRCAALAGFATLAFSRVGNLEDLQLCSAMFVAGAILLMPISWGVARLTEELKARTKVAALMCSVLPAVLPWWLLLPANMPWVNQCMLYSGLVFCVGALAPIATKSWKPAPIVGSVFFATLPITAFNLVNVAFTLVSLVAGRWLNWDIGWHATVSALIISLVTFIAAAGGGIGGGVVARARRPHLV